MWRGGVEYVLGQNHPGQFETRTPDYFLVNASALFVVHKSTKDIHLSVASENLLNRKYYDHLSRFKYFGIYNPGRSIMVSLQLPLTHSS